MSRPEAVAPAAFFPLLAPGGLPAAAATAASAGLAAAPAAASAAVRSSAASCAAWVADAPAPLPVFRFVLVLRRNFL
jgi:hypothetical protein